MDIEVLNYLNTQRVGVLTVEMVDGSPHAATVHFANSIDAGKFFFETDRRYRKSEPLFAKKETRASMVIGSSESDMRTLQMDGIARLIKTDEIVLFEETYHGKFPEKLKRSKDENYVRFLFIPMWWRFTDWTKPPGKLIITSEET